MIHGHDGFDRTLQISSLVQILLDPYYRRIIGFSVLIEKDWLNFGHPFVKRSGIVKDNYIGYDKDEEISPIFIQFLDCVHQLIYQFPTLFEFNIEFLKFLSNHSMSGKYGTFMFNNECEKFEELGTTGTISIWNDIFEKYKESFLNPFYNSNLDKTNIIYPNYSLIKIRLWEENYFQFSDRFNNFLYKSKNYYEVDRFLTLKEIKNKNTEINQLKNTLDDLIKLTEKLNLNYSQNNQENDSKNNKIEESDNTAASLKNNLDRKNMNDIDILKVVNSDKFKTIFQNSSFETRKKLASLFNLNSNITI